MHKYISLLIGLVFALISCVVSASNINVYEKPDTKSKVIATLKGGEQIMPIFYTEKRDWVKIANPKNGDVGWAQVSELKGPIVITNVDGSTVRQQIIVDKDKQPQVYSVVQYSGPRELKPEEARQMVKDMEKRQAEMRASMQNMQENMQKMMQESFKDFDNWFATFPVIQPVIVVPDAKEPKKAAKK